MGTARSARLETRLTPEQKELLERAAAYSGRSVTDFVISHAEAAARKVVEQLERLHLDEEQSRRLVEALLFPKKPVKKLREAIARHRKQVTSR